MRKPHICKRVWAFGWTCGISNVAEGNTPYQAWKNWMDGECVLWAHPGVANGLSWREYVNSKAAHPEE